MGLDIYVRWDDITEDEQKAQYTGFSDAPDAGYLRFNWAGVGFMRSFAAEHSYPNPIQETFQDWEGGNGEGYDISGDKIAQLLDYRAKLEGWLVEHPEPTIPDEDHQYYYRKIRNWITLINFIHGKIDKPGLAVIYG